MSWAEPRFSRSRVDRAGARLRDTAAAGAVDDGSLEVINNWRACHSFALNTLQMGLRRRAQEVDRSALIAQRLKRLPSIARKLQDMPTMNLSQMQDIGGCRAVVSTVSQAEAVAEAHKGARMRHKLVRVDDYIATPKWSGYRSVHLIYRYASDRKETYNGLLIEIQIRSRLQHAWATAVETVGTFLEQSLKASRGSRRWLRFFRHMGSAIALREKRPTVPRTPGTERVLVRQLRRMVRDLDVKQKLESYQWALRTMEDQAAAKAFYFLLVLEPSEGSVKIGGYGRSELELATVHYLEWEQSIRGKPGAEAVLVSVDSMAALKRAYPNYFLDTRVFLDAVEHATR